LERISVIQWLMGWPQGPTRPRNPSGISLTLCWGWTNKHIKAPFVKTNCPHCTLPNNPQNHPTMSQTSSWSSLRSDSPTLFEQLQADYPWLSLQYPERTPTPQLARWTHPLPIEAARTCENWQMASTHAAMVAQFTAILHWPLEHVLQQFRQSTPIMETAWLLVARGPTSPKPLPVPPHVGTPYPSPRI